MSHQPSLLIIGPTPPPYHGVAVATKSLLGSCLKDKFDLIHLDLADRRGIAHVNKPDLQDVLLFMRQWVCLWRMLILRRPQVVYLVLSQTTIGFIRDSLFIWPSVLLGARIVVHLHGGAFRQWYDARLAPMKTYIRAVLAVIGKMIVLGESLRPIFSGLLPEDRLAVVPNGVDCLEKYQERPIPNGTRPWRILHLNTLNRMKGTLVLLAAIPIILRQRKDVAFVFAGAWSHPSHQREAERYIAEHRLQPYVTFLGEVTGSAKDACLDSADLFVFPGIQQEGQPMVVLEAMAAGLPIVFTNQGCLRETVIDGECGVEVRSNDPVDLAVQICALLDYPDEQRRLGLNAFRRAHLFFRKDRHIDRMIEVLQSSLVGGISSTKSESIQTSQSPITDRQI